MKSAINLFFAQLFKPINKFLNSLLFFVSLILISTKNKSYSKIESFYSYPKKCNQYSSYIKILFFKDNRISKSLNSDCVYFVSSLLFFEFLSPRISSQSFASSWFCFSSIFKIFSFSHSTE